MAKPGLTIIVPVFNEKAGIGRTVDQLAQIVSSQLFDMEVVLVNDGSTDGTEAVLDACRLKDFRVVNHKRNLGYGRAIKTGMAVARYPYLAITDADGTYPNERIPELFAQAVEQNADMVVGSRTGEKAHVPLIRRPTKWILTRLARYLTQTAIPDLNSGLRIMRRSTVERFVRLLPDGFSFTTTITLAMLTNGYQVGFVPINYHVREGKSKIRPIRDTINFLQLIIRTVLYFDPLRVFLPISLSLLFMAVLAYVFRIIRGYGFGVTIPLLFLSGVQMLAIGMLADLIVRRLNIEPGASRE